MSGALHYADVYLRAGGNGMERELHARLLYAIHLRNSGSGAELQASWPLWRTDNGDFGPVFRAFGSQEDLAGFAETVQPLGAAGLISVQAVATAPADAGSALFLRDRSRDRAPSRQRRLERRRAARGETGAVPGKGDKTGAFHVLYLPSSSTDQSIPFFIRKARLSEAQNDLGGASYGLGRPVPVF